MEEERTGKRYANSEQFLKALLRMMPAWASETREGVLVAHVIALAWQDGSRISSKVFFRNETKILEKYCNCTGLSHEQISKMYFDHCPGADL